MSLPRKVLLTTTVALLTGLASILVSTKISPDRPVQQQQSRAGASPTKPPVTPQPEPDSPESLGIAADAFAQQNDPNPKTTNPDSIVDEELTEAEQKSLWLAFSEARREVREIPEAWADREQNLALMRLQAFAGREVAADAAPEKVAGSRVEYRRAVGLTEWYNNGTEALEHGFTVTGRPGHLAPAEEVVLEMRLEGLAAAERDADGQ